MSDKSFGDHFGRSVVKNPLLSSAMTALSLEDLSHAVLLPAEPLQPASASSERKAPETRSTRHDHEDISSGDTNKQRPVEYATLHENRTDQDALSAAASKVDDEFDVSVYFARLQGTKYISAPLHIDGIPRDGNAAIGTAEENLEEINLNEPDKPQDSQQSLTSDLAQNLSQLPNVLPHVASAVFSSFSSMLNLKGSREQTPENLKPSWGAPVVREAETTAPSLRGVEDAKNVAPPPKEPPIGGIGSYRIATKKKYAQIPGLTTGVDSAAHLAMPPHQPQTSSVPLGPTATEKPYPEPSTGRIQYFTPDTSVTYQIPEVDVNREPNVCASVNAFDVKDDVVLTYGDLGPNERVASADIAGPEFPVQSASTPVIPPPPMFTNVKKDTSICKSVLPPSVARRISSNHPIIKPQAITPSTITNIFVPTLQDDGQTFDQTHLKLLDPMVTSTTPEFSETPTGLQCGSAIVPVSMFGSEDSRSSVPLFSSLTSTSTIASSVVPESSIKEPSSSIVNTPIEGIVCDDTLNQPTTTNLSLQPDLISSVTMHIPPTTIPSANPMSTGQHVIKKSETHFDPTNIGQTSMDSAVQNASAFVPSTSIPLFLNQQTANVPTDSLQTPPEPPKAIGNVNFRLNKKRPQYYSGPVEGIGAISNNIKPVIAPVDANIFQGALFTPTHPADPHLTLAQQPFDINTPANPAPFDISHPQQSSDRPEFNTSFDLSRQTNEVYEPTKESSGFGIIGSLKSKLNSIDINKIQSKVTTFFDPAYNNEGKIEEETSQTFQDQNTFANHYAQNQGSNFEIFVPNIDATSRNPHDMHAYEQPSQYHQNPYSYYQSEGQNYQQQAQTIYSSTMLYPGSNLNENISNTSTYHTPGFNITTETAHTTPHAIITDSNIKFPALVPSKENFDINQNTEIAIKNSELKTEQLQNLPTYNVPQLGHYNKEIPSSIEELTRTAPQKNDNVKTADIDKMYPILAVKDFFDIPQPSQLFNPIASTDSTAEKLLQGSFPTKLESLFKVNEDLPVAASIFRSPVEGNLEPAPIGFKTSQNTIESQKVIKDAFNDDEQFDFDSLIKPIDKLIDDPFDDLEKEEEIIPLRETNLVESLSADQIPIVGVSTVPLFGLSTIIADKPKEAGSDSKKIIFELPKTEILNANNMSLFENFAPPQKNTRDDSESRSDLNMCVTCREVKKPGKENEMDNLTNQLIGNLTSPIQLSNAVEVSLVETNATDNREGNVQGAEKTQISAETTGTIPIHSVTENEEKGPREFGWTDKTEFSAQQPEDHDYTFKLDPNSIGFFGNNSLFFDKVPSVSEDLKTEFENTKENQGPRCPEIPTAPPAEEDSTSEGTGGLDVHSIEQDANKDFPIYEDFLIEPSETDENKTEFGKKEMNQDAKESDTFTNRIDKFKKLEETVDHDDIFDRTSLFTLPPKTSPAITIASYFDTGNYAAETHYRNSFGSPPSAGYPVSTSMRIPPGFEEEYHRRMSGTLHDKTALDKLKDSVPLIPDTTTQTSVICTSTYTAHREVSPDLNYKIEASIAGIVEEVLTAREPNEKPDCITTFAGQNVEEIDAVKQAANRLGDIKISELQIPETKPLPDPMNFFSSPEVSRAEPGTFNRLASYFASPPASDPSKSFFELSQSQNHYRHANDGPEDSSRFAYQNHRFDNNVMNSEKQKATFDLIKDLTSTRYIPNEQIVRTVNYFTIEYDDPNISRPRRDPDSSKIEPNHSERADDNNAAFYRDVKICEYCCDFNTNVFNINEVSYKVKATANDNNNAAGSKGCDVSMERVNAANKNVTINLEGATDGVTDDAVTVLSENRSLAEYNPVKYHWFYRVDIEGKSIWRGFSEVDSKALEEAYLSPDLNEKTLVATDGGRYDVNVVGRLRTAVYWSDKPTNVLRCSWFYKGTTDARYVPYSEAVAERLENEYLHAVTTGEWHRKLLLPNNEMVVMHGPSVMVHFLHSGSTDGFSAPPQSAAIPRVVRRGSDESEIEDTEPSSIDHLLLLCHGVGSACDMRFRSVEEVVDDFRATSLQLVQSHYRNSFDNGAVSRIEVLPISWHASLHSGETGVDKRLAQVTLDSIPKLRSFTNETVLDVLFYTSPVYCQTIIDTVCKELNRIYGIFLKRNPEFRGGVSLGGHSLGSVILYDLLCHQTAKVSRSTEKVFVVGSAGTGQSSVKYPNLDFEPTALYALGSPIAIFECIRGVESLGLDFALPTCRKFFNIFHPYDPIAYRIEPLINPGLKNVKPEQIPHHKGRKRMHLELKDTMARVGADLKQKFIDSLKTTWNKWKPQSTEEQLEKVVEEIEKDQLFDEREDGSSNATREMLGKLNEGRRIDYVLQEAPLEVINEYLFAMTSHVGYWESEDTMLLMLREIYADMGVDPDSTVPQQSLTVQRTRLQRQDGVITRESPTTSHSAV
ncbi:uncharacterized protein LOC101741044 isoform X2 [Bombyx mori]|uniref:Uncharacterized protein n=1 Tax=Bombyx mori TaxID=7091 RepID=A0A8R2AIF3_BOMMO|nr:uncharacterized protein LOC101741044 isoform X2 [Bombyx mori]